MWGCVCRSLVWLWRPRARRKRSDLSRVWRGAPRDLYYVCEEGGRNCIGILALGVMCRIVVYYCVCSY